MRKWTCKCPEHVVDDEVSPPKMKEGPYVIRVAGTGLETTCGYCAELFVVEEE